MLYSAHMLCSLYTVRHQLRWWPDICPHRALFQTAFSWILREKMPQMVKKAGRTGEWDSLQAPEITYGGICDCELALGHVTLLSLPRPSIAQCCAIAHAHSLAFSVVWDFLRCLNGDCCRLFRPFQERVAARKCCQTTVKRQTYMVGWQSLWMTIWNEQGRSLLTSVLLCIVVASILCFGVDLQCRSFCVFSVSTLSVSRYLQLAGSISVMREVRRWYFLQRNSLVCTLVLC